MNGALLTNKNAKDRSKTDFYPTPENVTLALLNFLSIPRGSIIWEPAAGEGHMASVFKRQGYRVIATEKYDRGYGLTGRDFLSHMPCHCDWIITNPPFTLFEEFVRKCISLGKPFALLAKSQCWHAECRGAKLFYEFPPAAILPLTWRPDFYFGKKGGAPTMECIWTVWGSRPALNTIYHPLLKPKGRDNDGR